MLSHCSSGSEVTPITIAGCLAGLVIDGTTHMICTGPAPSGASTVQNLGGGVFLATNADGTTATWTIPVVPSAVAPTVVVEAPAGTFTATMPDGSTVSWTIPTAAAPVVLPTLSMTGNPDGSDTLTWTAPDGSTIVFTVQPPVDLAPYLTVADLAPYQTVAAHTANLVPVYGNDNVTVLFHAHL